MCKLNSESRHPVGRVRKILRSVVKAVALHGREGVDAIHLAELQEQSKSTKSTKKLINEKLGQLLLESARFLGEIDDWVYDTVPISYCENEEYDKMRERMRCLNQRLLYRVQGVDYVCKICGRKN